MVVWVLRQGACTGLVRTWDAGIVYQGHEREFRRFNSALHYLYGLDHRIVTIHIHDYGDHFAVFESCDAIEVGLLPHLHIK